MMLVSNIYASVVYRAPLATLIRQNMGRKASQDLIDSYNGVKWGRSEVSFLCSIRMWLPQVLEFSTPEYRRCDK